MEHGAESRQQRGESGCRDGAADRESPEPKLLQRREAFVAHRAFRGHRRGGRSCARIKAVQHAQPGDEIAAVKTANPEKSRPGFDEPGTRIDRVRGRSMLEGSDVHGVCGLT